MNPDTLRIPLPDELRERILSYRSALETLLAEYNRQAEEAPARLASLETAKDEVGSELHRLRNGCSPDDPAAIDQIARLETRLQVIFAQLETAREAASSVATPPKFCRAGDILQLIRDLTLHWRKAQESVIAAQLRPFCVDEREARNLACMTAAIQSLSRLRDAWVWRRTESARPGSVDSLNCVFDRALRGQPALMFDSVSPEPPIASEQSTQSDSTAICEQPRGTAEAETRNDPALVNDGSLLHVRNPQCGHSTALGTFPSEEAVQA